MSAIAEAEKLVFSLSEKDRAALVGKMIRSLHSPGWDDDDDGVAEALRRSDELKANPELGMSIEELDRRIRERFGWKS
jgi:putative addiction module component (TIGR02574 family)